MQHVYQFRRTKNLKDFLCKTHILLPQEGNNKGGKSNIYPHIHTHSKAAVS